MPHDIPDDAMRETFLAGSGPGGQNANKVATNVQLHVDIYRLGLSPHAFRRLREIAGNRISGEGELLIVAREYRTREANREAAREKLDQLLAEAWKKQTRRIATKPGKTARKKRVDAKKRRSAVKAGRGRLSRGDY